MTNIAAMTAMILGDMFGSFELELLWLLGVRSTLGRRSNIDFPE